MWEGGSALATVEEAATAAADEADDGQGGQRCAVFFFSLINFITVTATATEGRGDGAAAVVSSADPFS
jgi:hypothetical protein